MRDFVESVAWATGMDLNDDFEVTTEEVSGGVLIRKTWVASLGQDEALRVMGELAAAHPGVLIAYAGIGSGDDYGIGRVLLGAETLGETGAGTAEVGQLLADGDFNEALSNLRDKMFPEIIEGERLVLEHASDAAPASPGR